MQIHRHWSAGGLQWAEPTNPDAHKASAPGDFVSRVIHAYLHVYWTLDNGNWRISEWHARGRPMGAKPGDKTQVPQQYGWQYKFDACNMSFSPRNLTIVSVVLSYVRRDVTYACRARWEMAMQVGWGRNETVGTLLMWTGTRFARWSRRLRRTLILSILRRTDALWLHTRLAWSRATTVARCLS